MQNNLLILFCTLLFCTQTLAQAGYSSASVTMNRSNGIFAPDQVVIEEYLNYHRHNILLPNAGNNIKLSADWDNPTQNKVVIQIGLSTSRLNNNTERPLINTCLVIDKSGSMQSDQKLEKVKKALFKFIQGLGPNDLVSIVAYDNNAHLILPTQKAGETTKIRLAIEKIHPNGSTNLNEGLMVGYQEVLKNYKPNQSNRVVLLTDGIANVGVIQPTKIIAKSVAFNNKDIDISTIGVGEDLNHDLLRQLAKAGKGLNHFVGNREEDIAKVFEEELESLLAPIAKNIFLEIDCNQTLTNLLGYPEAQFIGQTIRIPLNNINAGLTQIFLLEFNTLNTKKPLDIKAQLAYTTASSKEAKTQVVNIHIPSNKIKSEPKSNPEIRKNHTIGQMAVALKEMGEQVENKNYTSGISTLKAAINKVETTYPNLEDKDILRVKKILYDNYRLFKDWMDNKAEH